MSDLSLRIRIRVLSAILELRRIRVVSWTLFILLLGWALRLLINERRSEKLKCDLNNWQKLADSIRPELNNLNSLTEYRRTEVLATKGRLKLEAARLKLSAAKLQKRAVLASTILPSVMRLENKFVTIKRRTESLRGIASSVESDTFYTELLLWLLAPYRYDEALFGDLQEEYLLYRSIQGEEKARVWRRSQLKMTLKDCLWEKFERIAAIGTLADLISRFFRK